MGRPTIFTQGIADEICSRLMDGQSLRRICLDETMPSKVSVLRWLMQEQSFQGQYAQAREVQADTLADETVDIADDGSNDWMDDGRGGRRLDPEAVQRSRLRVDQRKWYASKLAPKKYGDKLDLNHSGSIARPVESLSDAELEEEVRKGRKE